MYASQAKTEPRPIADIVREKTNDGAIIVDYLVDVVLGKFEDTTHWHRMEATRQLAKLGVELPQAVLKVAAPSANGSRPSRAPGKPRRNDEMADLVKAETSGGKDIVQFLVDVMQGKLEGFKPHHRIAAARELIKLAFANVPDHSDDTVDTVNGECRNKSCYHWSYNYERWHHGPQLGKALERIYGSERAATIAIWAVNKLRADTIKDHYHVPDHDFTPIDNPEDDPYGKGSYAYDQLCSLLGDNQAIRKANKAVEEYKLQLAKDQETKKESADEEPPVGPHSGSHSNHPETTSAEDAGGSPATPDHPHDPAHPPTEHPHDPPVGAVSRTAHDLAHPAIEHPHDPSSSVTLSSPPVILSEAEGPPAHDLEHPAIEHPHNPSSSVTLSSPSVILSEAEGPPAHDLEHPAIEHPQDPSSSVILSEAEGPPARDPDRPPGRRRRRKRPRRIHLGPPDEDPPDDHPRRNRETGDIRIPLKNLHSTSPVPI